VTTSVENFTAPPSHLKVKRGDVFERVELQPASGFTAWGWGWNQFGLQAHDGEWWFPSEDGLYRYAAVNEPHDLSGRPPLRVYRGDRAGGTDGVFRVFEDSHGNIWFTSVSHHQLIRWERVSGQFHRFSTAGGWPVDGIATVIRESAEGDLWIGSFNEILRFRGGRLENIHAGRSGEFSVGRDLHIDRAGRVWAATANTGCTVVTTPARRPPHVLFVIHRARAFPRYRFVR
jgi:ligand-binding sensor domain-containing protein